MDPPSLILLSSPRRQYIKPVRLTAMILCHSSSSSSATEFMPWSFPMTPATLAAPSRRPCLSLISAIQLSTSCLLAISTFEIMYGTDGVMEVKYDSTSPRTSESTSAMQTVPPRCEMSLAVARPIPLPPPVTAMTLPWRDMFRQLQGYASQVSCQGTAWGRMININQLLNLDSVGKVDRVGRSRQSGFPSETNRALISPNYPMYGTDRSVVLEFNKASDARQPCKGHPLLSSRSWCILGSVRCRHRERRHIGCLGL